RRSGACYGLVRGRCVPNTTFNSMSPADRRRPALPTDLQPPFYFHGTRADMSVGDTLLPRRVTGAAATRAPMMPGVDEHPEADQWVPVTTAFALASAYAWKSRGAGPPTVLVVNPSDDLDVVIGEVGQPGDGC